MKIARIEAIPFHAERDAASVTGTAGSPSRLQSGRARYRWAENYPVIYSTQFETALVRITLDSGLAGWGEAQAPVAPEVACTIIDRILGPVLEGGEFDGTTGEIEALWWKMYSTMRVRGQAGGFMLDAIAGIDIALWDLAGKVQGKRVAALIGEHRARVPAYLSGLPGGTAEGARPWLEAGFREVKIFHHADTGQLLRDCDDVMALGGRIAVDALWRLTPENAPAFEAELASRSALWLEAPLQPESARAHGELARAVKTPVAIGESYRTLFELEPFFDAGAMRIVQPDLGRTGITEGLRIARFAEGRGVEVAPHVSIAMGPQIAAAIHFAAAVPNCTVLEFNPTVVSTANRYLKAALRVEEAGYVVPAGPGLGIELEELGEGTG
jgi:D-galactarolactone cycloisomerase